eukprot:273731_1
MHISSTSIVLICMINILLSTTDVLFTTSYGTPEGDAYEALNQGRINGITNWGIKEKRLKINAWSADKQTKFDQYSTDPYTDYQCTPFTLSPTDYITGYKIYIEHNIAGDIVRGLRFYTLESYIYSCIGSYFVATYTYSYIFNQHEFYYLTGFKITSASIINQIQLQFTKLSLISNSGSSEIHRKPSTNPITISPTVRLTHTPTTNPIIYLNTNMPSVIPTINPTHKPSTNPTLEPSEFPTEEPTMNPTYTPTLAPSDDLDIIIEVTQYEYVSDGEVNEATISIESTVIGDIIAFNNSKNVNNIWDEIGMFVIVSILILICMTCIVLLINIIHIKYKDKQTKEIKIVNETKDTEGHMDYDIQLQLALDAIDTIGGPMHMTNTIGFITDKSDNSKTNSDAMFEPLPESESESEDQETDDDESDDGMYEPGSTVHIKINSNNEINIHQITPGSNSPFGYINPNNVAELLCFKPNTNHNMNENI